MVGDFVNEIRYGGELVDYDEDAEPVSHWWYSLRAIRSTVGSVSTNKNADVSFTVDSGKQYNIPAATVKTLTPAKEVEDLYVARTRAMVSEVLPKELYASAGTRVRLVGYGFDANTLSNNKVVFAGNECEPVDIELGVNGGSRLTCSLTGNTVD